MGIKDRDFMRESYGYAPPERSKRRLPKTAQIGIIALLLGGAATWLLPDVKSLLSDREPRKGSLIVNINTATQDELETIPGIGPTLAAQIIAHRPYASADDLLKVPGIGRNDVKRFRPFIEATYGQPR